MTGKKDYEQIPIPKELSETIEEAISYGVITAPRISHRNMIQRTFAVVLVLLTTITCLMNFNPAFVSAVEQIPVLGQMFHIFSFREIRQQDSYRYIDAVIPKIEYEGNSDMENRVNLEISHLIQEEMQRSEEDAKEYYDAFVQTGGDPKEFRPISVTIDYEVKSILETTASFIISKYETLASAYNMQYFYNIDLETGNYLSLRDWLGPEYRQIAAKSIQQQIDEWPEDQKAMLFPDIDWVNLITENRNFYIDKDGRAVVVFDKYEIAVGAMGVLEFPVEPSASYHPDK